MSQLSPEHYLSLYNDFRKLKVLDDIICHRAADNPPVPILGYPRNVHSVNDYELFTGERLDHFIDAAVKHFIARGFEPVTSNPSCFPPLRSNTQRKVLILEHPEWTKTNCSPGPFECGFHCLFLRLEQTWIYSFPPFSSNHSRSNPQFTSENGLQHHHPRTPTTGTVDFADGESRLLHHCSRDTVPKRLRQATVARTILLPSV